MLIQNIADIDSALLESVCAERWPESSTLEFKREPPGLADRDKHELLKDICAFANADGGDIVFGIDEVDGSAANLTPISSESADGLMRRITQTVESGIEPRLPNLQIRRIDIDSGYFLIVRIPASYLGPHSIRVNNSRRFVMRNGTNTSDLSFEQLRTAFDRTASLGEQARAFIRDRNNALQRQEAAKRLLAGPISAIHLVPLSGMAGKQAPDLQALHNDFTSLLDPNWGGGSRAFNLDGLVVYPGGTPSDGHYGYTLICRTGAMEAASLAGGEVQQNPSAPKKLVIWSLDMTQYFRGRTAKFLALAKQHGFSGPAMISFSMLHVGGYELGIDGLFWHRSPPVADRPHLIAPSVWIDSLESVATDDVVRPLLDTLWQGFGMERCLDYDPTSGQYKPRRG